MNATTIFPARRQASMYLQGVPEIENLRVRFNPVQARLIPAHVTLCREDEVQDWLRLESRIQDRIPISLTLGFGRAVRDDNLVFLPVVFGGEQFEKLRHVLLNDGIAPPRKLTPHITVIHPRNGVCTDAAFDEILQRLPPFKITLREISLIEQTVGGPWIRISYIGVGSDKL